VRVPFIALIPARLASTRLPDKPLADLGGVPMVVRVARRAAAAGATRVVIAADDPAIVAAARAHGVEALLTDAAHRSGTDRLAEAATTLGLDADTLVVNVQGDEPLIPPEVVADVAALLAARPDCEMATAAHRLTDPAEFLSPHVVKVVLDARQRALLFSRAPIPWSRDAFAGLKAGEVPVAIPDGLPVLRHVGLYAYRAGFLRAFPALPAAAIEVHESLEQLRALWHGARIAVHTLDAPLPPGVDTPEDLARVRALLLRSPD
jgi:3-deoxy-manno-octulosonate cytidylyltransferase (CMP-KDO synthetase)